MSISKIIPSGSTSGKPVNITAIATAGTLFHTAHATAFDEIYLYLTNTNTTDENVTVEFGGATAPDWNVKFIVPAGETILAIAGVPLTGGLTCKAFSTTTAKVNMLGYVNRIS